MPEGGTSLCPGRWHLHPILQRATRTPSLGTVEHPLPQTAGFRPFGQLRRAGSCWLLLERPHNALTGALVAGATVERPVPQNLGLRLFDPPLLLHDRIARVGGPLC